VEAKAGGLGLSFSDKKIIPRNMEQDGTDGISVGIPPILWKRKTLEFRSEPLSEEKNRRNSVQNKFRVKNTLKSHSRVFSKEKKPRNSIPNQFQEEKKPRNSVPNHFRKRITSEFCSKPILGTENTRKSVPNHFWQQQTLEKIPLFLAAS
jgi:hypothetical protein